MKHFLIALMLSLFSNLALGAVFDPSLEWRQLESAHFRIIYAEPLQEVAQEYLNAGELALAQLTPFFPEPAKTPITVLLTDHTDFANGMATFFPYPIITVFPVLPGTTDSIDHYSHWAYELMLHELVHLLTFQPVRGFYQPFRYVFGSVIRPNGILPRWYLEGLAVELESRLTPRGRLRSSFTWAQLRALSQSDVWKNEDISDINESGITSYPYGQRPYLFGAPLWHRLAEETNTRAIRDLNERFARRLPFLLNQPLRDTISKSWPEFWNETKSLVTSQSKSIIEQIEQAGAMKLEPLVPIAGQQQALPTLSASGQFLAYVSHSSKHGAEINVFDLRSQKVIYSLSTVGTTRLSWHGDYLYFDQIRLYRRYNQYRDLFRVNIQDRSVSMISNGLRAQDPIVSANGQSILFVQVFANSQRLSQLDLRSQKISTLLTPKAGVRLSQPVYLSDQQVAVIGRDLKGADQIIRLDLKTKKRSVLRQSQEQIFSLRSTQRGLMYASNSSGTANVYLLSESDNDLALSNSKTEISQFDFDEAGQRLIVAELQASGRRLFVTPYQVYQPAKISEIPLSRFANESKKPKLPAPPVKSSDRSYSPWGYMLPRYWIPFIYPVEGGMLFQGTTSGQDPTLSHGYQVDVSYDSVTKQTSYGVGYLNSTTALDWQLRAAESNELLAADSDRVTNRLVGLTAGSFFYGLSNSWRWNLSTQQIQTEFPSAGSVRHIDRLGAGGSIQYNSAAARIVPARWGEGFWQLGALHFFAGDERLSYERYTGTLGLKFRDPLPAQHSLLIQAKGSLAEDLPINNILAIGDRTIGGNYLVSLINSPYLLRGYPSGAIVGRTLVNANLEYRFPAWFIESGRGTFPWYFRNLEAAIFYDAALVDGAYLDPQNNSFVRSRTSDIFSGTGLEFTLHTTAAYHLPVSVTLGLYYGFNSDAGGGFLPFLSIGYSGHGGLDQTTTTQFRPDSLAR